LCRTLQSIPGVGAWTASTAVADVTGDFSVFTSDNLNSTNLPGDLPWLELSPEHISIAIAVSMDWMARKSNRVQDALKSDKIQYRNSNKEVRRFRLRDLAPSLPTANVSTSDVSAEH
jgi:hypothetical protein